MHWSRSTLFITAALVACGSLGAGTNDTLIKLRDSNGGQREIAVPLTPGTALVGGVDNLPGAVDIATQAELDAFGENVTTAATLTTSLAAGGTIYIREDFNLPDTATISKGGTKLKGLPKADGTLPTITFTKGTPLSYAIYVDAPDVEISGFHLRGDQEGADPAGFTYFLIELSNTRTSQRCHIHDMEFSECNRAVSLEGSPGAPFIEDLTVERCNIHTWDGYAVSLGFSVRRAHILRNTIFARVGGDIHDADGDSIYFTADIEDCEVAENIVGENDRMGIEFTIVDGTFNRRNTIFRNRVLNVAQQGISNGHGSGNLVDGNYVENAGGIGIESADQLVGRLSSRIQNNHINGVSGVTACGIGIDKTYGDIVQNNLIENITASSPTEARGIFVQGAEDYIIQGNTIYRPGFHGIQLSRGASANTRGWGTVTGNTIRCTTADTVADQRAIYVFDTTVVVKDNTAWQAAGTTLGFDANCNSPAKVYCGHTGAATVAMGSFAESNLVVSY